MISGLDPAQVGLHLRALLGHVARAPRGLLSGHLDGPEQGFETVDLNTTVQQTIENLGAIIAETHAVVTYRDCRQFEDGKWRYCSFFKILSRTLSSMLGIDHPMKVLVACRRLGKASRCCR